MKPIGRWILVLTLAIPVSAGIAADRKFEKQFPATAGGTLRLETDLGSVKVIGTDENQVSVTVLLKGREKDVDGFQIEAGAVDGGVNVQGRTKTKRGWFSNSSELDAQYMIKVPRTYNLDLHTAGGDLDVSSLKGEVRGETSGGDIVVGTVEGRVSVETSGGDIRIQKVSGNLKAGTSGGDVVVGDIKGDADVETSGGDIRLGEVSGRVNGGTSGGSIYVRAVGANDGIHVETSGGDIEISVPKGIGASIDASTSGGDVVCDLPVTVSGRVSEGSIRGTVNGGGNKIVARTSGGDIRIKALP